MVAAVRPGAGFDAEAPRVLFEAFFLNVPGLSHDVAPDGQRQIMIQANEQEAAPRQLNVVLNWSAEVRRRASAAR